MRSGIFAETFRTLCSVFVELPLRYYQKMSAFDRKEEDELIKCSGVADVKDIAVENESMLVHSFLIHGDLERLKR